MKWFLKFTPFSFTSSSVGSAKLSRVSKILGFPLSLPTINGHVLVVLLPSSL